MRALEARRPEPPLFPADPDRRRAVEEAEEWGDQVLQPLVRRVLWQALSRDTGAQLSYLDGARLVPPTPRVAARLSGGAVAWAERRFNNATDVAVRADLANLPAHLDRVDRWIGDGVLDGETTNAADLQIASGLRLLLTVEDVRPQIDARPGGGFARRLFPPDPGRVPSGALPAEWLASAASA
jgi:glutathione S-transferase